MTGKDIKMSIDTPMKNNDPNAPNLGTTAGRGLAGESWYCIVRKLEIKYR